MEPRLTLTRYRRPGGRFYNLRQDLEEKLRAITWHVPPFDYKGLNPPSSKYLLHPVPPGEAPYALDVIDDAVLVAYPGWTHSVLLTPRSLYQPAYMFLIIHKPTDLVAGIAIVDTLFRTGRTLFNSDFAKADQGVTRGLDRRLERGRREIEALARLARR